MINEKRLIDRFISLGQINSYSGHEKDVADTLEADLRTLAFDVVRDNAGAAINGNTGNVIATKKGSIPGATPIMFCSHMDTVTPTEGWTYRIEDGIIRSSGDMILGADDKAGIAAIMEAMTVVAEENIPHGDMQVVFTIAEETGLNGAKHMDYSLITAKCAFVYDMGDPVGCVTVRAPYQDSIKAKFIGKAAHAGARPEDGVNAILAAGRAISKMNLGRIDRETTANIGIINGGTATNIVPDLCELNGEARSRNEEKLDAQVQHMVEALHSGAAEAGAGIDVEIIRAYNGYQLTDEDEVIRIGVTAAHRVGVEPEMHETGGGSDANIFNAKGIKASPIGVGFREVHCNSEYQPIVDLVKAAEMALEIVRVASGQV